MSGLEFAFRSMQAIATGIFLFYATIGQIVAILIVPLINTITVGKNFHFHFNMVLLGRSKLPQLEYCGILVKALDSHTRDARFDQDIF